MNHITDPRWENTTTKGCAALAALLWQTGGGKLLLAAGLQVVAVLALAVVVRTAPELVRALGEEPRAVVDVAVPVAALSVAMTVAGCARALQTVLAADVALGAQVAFVGAVTRLPAHVLVGPASGPALSAGRRAGQVLYQAAPAAATLPAAAVAALGTAGYLAAHGPLLLLALTLASVPIVVVARSRHLSRRSLHDRQAALWAEGEQITAVLTDPAPAAVAELRTTAAAFVPSCGTGIARCFGRSAAWSPTSLARRSCARRLRF